MKYFIWFELKRYGSHPKTWILLGLVFGIALVYLNVGMTRQKEYNMDAEGRMFEGVANSGLNIRTLEKYPDTIYTLVTLKETGANARIAAINQNYQEYNRFVTVGYMLLADEAAEIRGKLWETVFKYASADMWELAVNDMDHTRICFTGINSGGMQREDYYQFILRAKFFYNLYQKDLKPINDSFIDSSTFSYHYMNKILPWIMGGIIAILLFDCVSSDRLNDCIKLILTQPISRRKYILSKVIAGFINASFILITPMLTIVLILGIHDSFSNLNYPILYLKRGFQSIKTIPNHIEFDNLHFGFNHSVGISLYSGTPKGDSSIDPRIGLMSLSLFLLLALLLVLCNILFLVSVTVLLSVLIKNKLTGFIISILTVTVGLIGSNWLLSAFGKNLSPFMMNNAVRIMNGTYNVTPLGTVIILGVSNIYVILITLICFRKKSI